MDGVLQFMGLQRVGHNWATKLNWSEFNMILIVGKTYPMCKTSLFNLFVKYSRTILTSIDSG